MDTNSPLSQTRFHVKFWFRDGLFLTANMTRSDIMLVEGRIDDALRDSSLRQMIELPTDGGVAVFNARHLVYMTAGI